MSAEPSRATGYADDSALFGSLDGYGSLVDYLLEQSPELIWPQTITTYSRMRSEPQLAAILNAYTLAIRRARWSVDPAGCRDEVAAQVADDLGLPVKGADEKPTGARRRRFVFAEHLRLSLLDLPLGHMPFEQEWAEEGGRWRLSSVQERMPQTIQEVNLNPDGTLRGVVQHARTGGRQPAEITTANHALVWYVNDREGSNFYGRSILRPAFPLWIIKDQVMRVHATSIRRFGLGIPTAQALPGTSPTPQEISEAQRAVGSYRATEHSAVAMPPKFKLALEGMTGSVPDAVAFLNYLDRQMTRYTLTSLLDMATAERGARSLGETVMDLMVYAQQAVADSHADAATAQIVVPLVDANFGEDEPAPRIVCGDVGADVELTAQDVFWLTAYGAITNEPQMENFLRQRYGIPTLDATALADLRKQAAAAVASGAGHLPFAWTPPTPPTKPGGE